MKSQKKKKMNLGHLGLQTRSVGQIKEIPCGHHGSYNLCSIDLKSGQNIFLDKILDEFEFESPEVIN